VGGVESKYLQPPTSQGIPPRGVIVGVHLFGLTRTKESHFARVLLREICMKCLAVNRPKIQ
jgi:hypothetical protein